MRDHRKVSFANILPGLDNHPPELPPLVIRFCLFAAHDIPPMKPQADCQLFKELDKMHLHGTLLKDGFHVCFGLLQDPERSVQSAVAALDEFNYDEFEQTVPDILTGNSS